MYENTLVLNVEPLTISDAQFYKLCQANPELRIERTASGGLIIMPPTGTESGGRSAGLVSQLWFWNRQQRLGRVFDSSTGFNLPNGADRSPDASWIRHARWNLLTSEEKQGFAPICPDFVIELRSPTDSIRELREKMDEYMANGAQLGWLIDPLTRQVEIYEPDEEPEILLNPDFVSGDPILPGFRLDLSTIFEEY